MKSICTLLFICLFFYLPMNPTQEKLIAQDFEMGVKGGMTFTYLGSLHNTLNLARTSPKQSHPPGFSVGIIGEKPLTESLSFVGELSFLYERTRVTIYRLSPIRRGINSSNVQGATLIKYTTDFFTKPYVVAGLNLGYLLHAQYQSHLKYPTSHTTAEITTELRRLNLSVCLGIGQEFVLGEKTYFGEVRMVRSVSEYEDIGTGTYHIGNWINYRLECNLGFYF